MHDEARNKKKRMPHVHKDSGSNLSNNESSADVSVYCLQYHLSIVDKQSRFVLTTIWVSSYYFFEDSYSTIEKARNICSQEKMAYQQTRFKNIELQHCCSEEIMIQLEHKMIFLLCSNVPVRKLQTWLHKNQANVRISLDT